MMQEEDSHILAQQLQRLDCLLHREILRLRANYQLSLDEFRGLYISDEQVDQLLRQASLKGQSPDIDTLTRQAEEIEQETVRPGTLQRLAGVFGLSDFETDVLFLAWAPELDLKYETLYAYLNNDVTRKWPTRELSLRIFSRSGSQLQQLRPSLMSSGTLFRSGLLRTVSPNSPHPSWLSQGFTIAPRVSHILFGNRGGASPTGVEEKEPEVTWDELSLDPLLVDRLRNLSALLQGRPSEMVVVLRGPVGSGRLQAARALASAQRVPLIEVDVRAIDLTSGSRVAGQIRLISRLRGGHVYLRQTGALFDSEGHAHPRALLFFKGLQGSGGNLMLEIESGDSFVSILRDCRHLVLEFPYPNAAVRRQLWSEALDRWGCPVEANLVQELANRFRLTQGQILRAADQAGDRARLQSTGSNEEADYLFAAARAQSNGRLGKLAVKVNTSQSWERLVLPRATLRRLRELTAAIRSQQVVYADWRFGERITSGRGLKILFSGSSGTGKTMTAGVIARDLGVDLYKIDLSGVVSKYIGETEKNLDRIFQAAQNSNSILFFDEADALFGRRSEVKDAHDRYANIEVAYLLQKLEEHDGVVILASNLSRNIDQAFSRRMHCVIEFPLPDENLRRRLWVEMFPEQAPLAEDIDFEFLAKNFAFSGGDIRNVVLESAFLAASKGEVQMRHLVLAVSRQLLKQGKTVSATDFKDYYALLS